MKRCICDYLCQVLSDQGPNQDIGRMSSSSSQQSRSHGVPIRRDGFSVMDTEFDNIRERFDSEMRRMEDEMNKFRSEMMASMDGDVFKEHKSSKQSR